jgi:ATP adenylyltransferase
VDYLWTPWRYNYVTQADKQQRHGVPDELSAWPGDLGCVFCNMIAATDYAIAHGMDRASAERLSGIVLRGRLNYICVNRFPYTSGHLMVVPYDHQSTLGALAPDAAREMMDLAQRVERALSGLYHPDGFNIGLNQGKAAGAGVAGHLHLHALPRWFGDTNFLTTIGESRLLPEDLSTTWERVRAVLAADAPTSRTATP